MIKIYVADLAAYNAGFLVGEWINLPCDNLEERISAILREGEKIEIEHGVFCGEHEEFAIHDYESDIEGIEIGEYDDPEELNELAERLESLDKWDREKLEALLEYDPYYFRDLEDALDKLDDVILYPDINDERELGEYVVDEGLFGIEIPDALVCYIDYEAIGRDWNLSTSGGFTSKGFVEIAF